jgi:hypothetical protein
MRTVTVPTGGGPLPGEPPDSPLDSPSNEPRVERRRWWRWWLIPVAIVVVVLGLFAFAFVRYQFRTHPGAKSVDSALKTFRNAPTVAPRSGARARPPSGVYQLQGQGTEKISFPPNSQNDSALMPASVTDLPNGCWRWHVDYNVAHSEAYDFCPVPQGLAEVAFHNSQSWDFGSVSVKNVAVLDCEQPALVLGANPVVGQVIAQICTGTNSAIPGQSHSVAASRVVGIGPLTIGGVSTKAVHQLLQVTVTGAQKGTSTEDWWFAADTGMPIKVIRHRSVGSPSPLGTITYSEDGSWQLASLKPQT